MKIQKIRELARHQGLDPGKAEKVELIRAIQLKEGNLTVLPRLMREYAIKAAACGAQTVSPRPGAASIPEPAVFLR